MSADKKRRAGDPPDPVAAYYQRDQQARDLAARIKAAGGIKAWRRRHNEGGKAKP